MWLLDPGIVTAIVDERVFRAQKAGIVEHRIDARQEVAIARSDVLAELLG